MIRFTCAFKALHITAQELIKLESGSKIIQKQKGIIHSITLLFVVHMNTPSLVLLFNHINLDSISVVIGRK